MTSGDHILDPIQDADAPKIDDAVAVGEDLQFQERWWIFERCIWIFFSLVLVADALGVFGAGWLAIKEVTPAGSGMSIRYDRVLRVGTPAMVTVHFEPEAARNGAATLEVSNSVIKDLGAQRIIPQPQTSATGAASITYVFPVSAVPGDVEFELQPGSPGFRTFQLQVPGHTAFEAHVTVVP